MIRPTPAIRITGGLVLMTVSLLLGADLLGLFPNPYKEKLETRKEICEFLAINGSSSIQEGAYGAFEAALAVFVERNEDVLASGLRTRDGKTLIKTEGYIQPEFNDLSSPSSQTRVLVPIYKDRQRWGTLEVLFKPVYPEGIWGFWALPIVKLIFFILPLSFVGYMFYMRKILQYLDPTSVIPPRVKATLDTLSEGVVLLDNKERIVLANDAFADKVGQRVESLVGQKVSKFGWNMSQSNIKNSEMPWSSVMSEGKQQIGVKLNLETEGAEVKTFMVNGAPIFDGEGGMRGVLATFDDVTQIEEQNDKLSAMLKDLAKAHKRVRRQNQELEVLATKDPLTHCLNRRSFREILEAEFSKAQRYGSGLSCVMVDIDHFKSVNDNHGHQVGDTVLKKVAEVLRTTGRQSDVVCRYGGEEFCILLPNINMESAVKAAERYRMNVESMRCSGLSVTASFGVSSLEFECENPEEFLGQADKSLYAAKNSGRNRVICWGDDEVFAEQEELEPNEIPDEPDSATGPNIPQHIVNALMLSMAHRDLATAEHSRQVGDLCVAAAQGLMSFRECLVLEVAGQLHDIGKLGVPDSILLKDGPLTEEEWRVMRNHRQKSVEVIASIFLSPELVEIVRGHTAWYGGTKHSPGLPKGKAIPLGSRILSIADAFSAMTSFSNYRRILSYEEAFAELRRCAGEQFDPDIVEHFISVIRMRDESRLRDENTVSSEAKLEIGCEIEKLFVAVNTSSFETLFQISERLVTKATRHGFTRIVDLATRIKEASEGQCERIEILSLASKLMKAYGSKELYKTEVVEFKKAS